MGADCGQNQRSSTSASKRAQCDSMIAHGTSCMYTYCKRSIGWRYVWLVSARYAAKMLYTKSSHKISSFFDYNLLLVSSPVFFHCFSNSSSHGTRTFLCSGCTGTLTLWCSTVQYVAFPSRLFISPRIMAICLPTDVTLLFSRTFVPIGTAFRYDMLSARVTPPMNSH
jgi:hypothetical protein